MPRRDAILIAAQSGRALAAAARRAGLRPFVADLFGDDDTRGLAAGYRQVAGRFGAGPAGASLRDALAALAAEAGDPLGLVLGSGFEGSPALMHELDRRHRLIGAAPTTVSGLKDPARLAALCALHAIPHPPVSLGPVADPEAWLLKRRGGSGGSHIRPARPGSVPRGAYLQRRVPGTPMSLTVLADGRTCLPVAATAQWTAPGHRTPFRYGGAVDPGAMPPGVRAAATAAVEALVAATGLAGLASADLMIDGADWWLLEVNPRPGATLDVLDRRGEPLLARHVEAASGRLGGALALPPDAVATEICYAQAAIPRVPAVAWPDFVMDRPPAGSRIRAGAPICTVRAEGADAEAARRTVRARAEAVPDLVAGRAAWP
ncbi:ATP-grasp domain-containing protein [Methylobacterium sp. JK268]